MAWQPGQSGNPRGGIPGNLHPIIKALRSKARADADEAYNVLAAIMRNEEAELSLRKAAACEVLKLAGAYVEQKTVADDKPVPEYIPDLDAIEREVIAATRN
jgi:hypothetical protein